MNVVTSLVVGNRISDNILDDIKGNIYINTDSEEYYILSDLGRGYSLVGLKDGNRWKDPSDSYSEVFSCDESAFVHVTHAITIEYKG